MLKKVKMRLVSLFTVLLLPFLLAGFVSHKDLYGDRVFVFNTLKSVFGESSVETLSDMVLSQHSAFSGPCSVPGAIYYYDEDSTLQIENKSLDCQGTVMNSKLSLNASPSNIRDAWLHKTCQKLSYKDETLQSTLLNAELTKSSVINEENLIKLYSLFQSPNKETVKAINKSLDSGLRNLNWSDILYTFCVSDQWQKY